MSRSRSAWGKSPPPPLGVEEEIVVSDVPMARYAGLALYHHDGTREIRIDPRFRGSRVRILLHEFLHQLCPEKSERWCDRQSRKAARMLVGEDL